MTAKMYYNGKQAKQQGRNFTTFLSSVYFSIGARHIKNPSLEKFLYNKNTSRRKKMMLPSTQEYIT